MLTETFATVSLKMAVSETTFHETIRNCFKKVIFWSPSLGGIIRKRYSLEYRFTIDHAFSIITAREGGGDTCSCEDCAIPCPFNFRVEIVLVRLIHAFL